MVAGARRRDVVVSALVCLALVVVGLPLVPGVAVAGPAGPVGVSAASVGPGQSTAGGPVAPVVPSGDFSQPPGSAAAASDRPGPAAAVAPTGSPAPAPGRSGQGQGVDVSRLPVVERGATYDVFDAGGGQRVARLYGGPRNVRDGAGGWVPIDTTVAPDGKGRLAARATSNPVTFAASSAGELARGGPAGRSVGLRMDGIADRPAVVAGPVVTYPGVQPGVDLEYRVGSTLTKTTLLVASAAAGGNGVWRFPLSLDAGLTPKATAGGGVSIVDGSGSQVANVATPLMWDSKADPVSGDPGVYGPVSVTVSGDATAGWALELSADRGWLAAKERVFPVHVDPTLSWTGAWRDDAYVASGFPGSNYNVSWNATYGRYEDRVGRYDATWGEGRTYLKFDLSPVMGAQVSAAWMSMYFFHAYTLAPTWTQLVHVNCGWGSTTVTWNSQPCQGGYTQAFNVGRGQWADLDVTTMIQNQASGAWPNQGYLIQAGTDVTSFKRMAATEDSASPVLELSFNRSPSIASPQPPAPGNGWSGHQGGSGTTLAALSTDPDGDQVQYWYRVASSPDAETNVVWESGWTTASSVTVPAANLPAGRPYYWHVYAQDGYGGWTAPTWVYGFTPTNTLPPAPAVPGTPSQDQVLGSLTPTLSVGGVTDGDGDPVKYWFRIATGSDGATGQVVSSGWQSGTSWTVPPGVLKDGVPYTWTVTSSDSVPVWFASPAPGQVRPGESTSTVGRFRVDLRQGLGKTVPSDSVGAVNVNLYNGNLTVAASSPAITTANGSIGVGFTYNSAKQPESGLVGSYYDGLPAGKDFPAGEAPRLVRTDSAVDFNWGSGSPYSPAVGADQFRIRWTGYLTVPATGTYQFGATHDDGVRVTIGNTTLLNLWADAAVVEDFTGAVGVPLTAGTWVPVTVDYYENGGGAQVSLLQRRTDGGANQNVAFPVPSSWLSPNPAALPTGWTLSADLDGDGGYTAARVTDGAVILTDATGSTHTYTKKSDGGYTPPAGEYGTLGKDGTGNLLLQDGDGRSYRFDPAGNILSATLPADDRKPGSAQYTWSGTPSRLASITDPVSGRALTLRYNRAGDTCPGPSNGGYDPAPPAGMLCQIGYPDGTSTDVFYAGGTLAAIVDPGGEVTQFRYTGGLMTGYRDPLAVDWVAKDTATRDTDATWSLVGYDTTASPARVTHVQSPEPTGLTASPTGRVGHGYGYTGVGGAAPSSTVTVDGGPASSVTMDGTGRPVSATNPAGQTSSTGWSAKDLPLWTTDHTGRTTVTQYDTSGHPTGRWGPWVDSCFTAAAADGTRSPVASSSCDQAMPHTVTGYDEGMSGLAAAWWNNVTMTGAAAGHSTTVPASFGTSSPHPFVTGSSGYSARFTGNLTLPGGTYTFAADVGATGDDGARVFVDDQLAVARWDTTPQAVTADLPADYWRLSSPSAVTGPALTPSNVAFTGAPVTANDPTATASFAGTGKLSLPDGTFPSVVGSGTAPAVDLWFKTGGAGVLFGYQNAAASSYVPALYVGTDGRLRGVFWGGTNQAMDSGVTVTDNAWHHVALTTSVPDPAGKRTEYLYLDGRQVGTTSGVIDTLDMAQAQLGTGKTAGWDAGCPDWCPFTGDIADAALYSRPLGADRVAAHAAAGRPTFTSTEQHTGPRSNGTFDLTDGKPHRIRVDYKNPAGPSTLTLTATPADPGTGNPTGSPVTLDGTRLTPGYGLATSTTTDDSGTLGATRAAPTSTTATSYTDPAAGIDPALGLAVSTSVDPAGLNLTAKTGYKPYGAGSLLRPLTSSPPSGSPATVTTEWYQPVGATPAEAPRDNPCTSGVTESLPQYGLAKATVNPAPATGTPVATETIYDILGRPVANGHRNGAPVPAAWTCTGYDTRGRTTEVLVPAWGGAPARTVTTDHAAGGDPLTRTVTDTSTAATSTISTTVDLLGRTVAYTQSIPGTAATLTTTTAYNTLGQAVSATTTSSAGGPTSTLGWTYLPDGRADTVTLDGAAAATIGYDPTSKDVATVTYATTGTTLTLDQLTKDGAYRPVGQQWTIGSTRTITDTLTRSRAGRTVQAVTADSGDPGNDVDWSYQYDGAARLTQATLAATTARPKTATYGYQYAPTGGCGADPAAGRNGSRTGTTLQIGGAPTKTSIYCTDNAARLTEIKSTTGGTVIDPATVAYDAHGNATQIGTQRFDYDGDDRVTDTRESSPTPTQALTYTRDPLGRVTQRHTAATTGGDVTGDTRYGYTGADDSPDYQLTSTGTLLERYLPLPGGALLTKPLTGGQPTWSLPNLHGDTTATLTGATVTAGYLYDPYGQPLNPNTALPNTNRAPTTRTGTATTDAWHGSAQRAYEHTGGLNYTLMGARTYLPTLGQFTATDPIPGGNTTTYTYPQDPINSADLSGLMRCGSYCGGGHSFAYGYSFTYRLARVKISSASIVRHLRTGNRWMRLFPVGAWGGNCSLNVGATCHLIGGSVRVTHATSTSWSFHGLPGHAEGENDITFSFHGWNSKRYMTVTTWGPGNGVNSGWLKPLSDRIAYGFWNNFSNNISKAFGPASGIRA